jgi:hypothetical protein
LLSRFSPQANSGKVRVSANIIFKHARKLFELSNNALHKESRIMMSASFSNTSRCLSQWLLLASLCWLGSTTSLQAAEEVSYPRKLSLPGGEVVIHHPTVSDWNDFFVLSAWVPVEISPTGDSTGWSGSVKVQAETEIRYEERLVRLSNLRPVTAVADESMPEAAQSLKSSPGAYPLLKEALAQARQDVSLEYLLRALPEEFADSLVKPARSQSNLLPDIMISEEPAVLVLFDGAPRTAAIRNSQLEIVVNTDWTIFHDKASDNWYMIFGEYWLQNNSLSGGSWQVAKNLPIDFANLATGNGWEGLRKILPPKQADRVPPPFRLSYEPAELVLFDGPPTMQAIGDMGLQYVSNADHDIFLLEDRYYITFSGDWFSTRDLKRSWTAVKQLPGAFALIPPDSDKAHVLAMVPGTEEHRVAMIEAAMPRTQSVAQESGDGLQVEYEGEPNFVAISGTPLYRADNTAKQVIQHNNFYYLCQDAAWYSAASATGPWRPAMEIPKEIYDIPPDDPAYNVTFVKIGTYDEQSGRQAYIHTYGYSGTYTADRGIKPGNGPTASGTYYDPNYDPRARSWGYWPSYGYGGYWPAYGYGARYYPYRGGWGYGGYYDPFWGNPYPRSTSVTVDMPDSREWVVGQDGQRQPVNSSPDSNRVGTSYNANDQQRGMDDPTAQGHWYSGPEGTLYRIGNNGWQVQQGKKWFDVTEPVPDSVTREYQARLGGYASLQRYQQEQQSNP